MNDKVGAIYAVREAAEEHARAAIRVEVEGTPESRDELLDARMKLENTTHDAIVACHECGNSHPRGASCDLVRRIGVSLFVILTRVPPS